MMTRTHLISLLSIALLALACGNDEPSSPAPGPGPSLSFAVSECGGFGQATYDSRGSDYCDAEAIEWRYDAAAARLEITDKRVLLNCCGERSVSASWEGETLVIKELDLPEGGGGRCRCDCTFDFEIAVDNLGEAPLALRVEREVQMPDEQTTVYSGTLKLSEGSGRIVVDDTDLGGMCTPPTGPLPEPTDLTKSFDLSECGGFDLYSDGASPAPYCDAELLNWSYDASSQILSVDNRRVLLNCCGERSVKIAQDDTGAITITERDEAGDVGRCDCMCVFDLQAAAGPIAAAQVPFSLVREIVENGQASATVAASGVLDLQQGSGSVVVDATDVAPWCQES